MIGYNENDPMTPEFQLVAGNLALDFANTLDYRYDPRRRVELLPNFESFVAFADQSGILSGGEAHRLLARTSEHDGKHAIHQVLGFREALYFLFLSVVRGQAPSPLHLRAYNRFLSDVRVSDSITWQQRAFVLCTPDVAISPCGPLRPIMDAANRLLTSPDRRHIGECSDKTCRWLFLDHSKNHSRRWCSMALCGNRSKARRFYAQVRRGV
jgi:predicted RNA-binding Zn ribbon-like protein